MMRPLVSVVIPAFNAEAFIEQTCRSVFTQTYSSLEVIVVDDGSTDRTAEILGLLAASEPRLRIITQQNRGVAAARNRGIESATGEFIAPLDADDVWNHQKIERQVRRFEECGSGVGLVYCWWSWIDGKSAVLDRSPRWRVEGHVLERLVEINFSGPTSVPLYRRRCLVEIGGYNEALRAQGNQGCEDWDLAIRVAERYEVAVAAAVLVGYRRLSDSMSSNCERMWRSHTQVMGTLASRCPSLPKRAIRRSNAQFALHLAGIAFWARRYGEACRWGIHADAATLMSGLMPHLWRLLFRRMWATTRRELVHFDESRPPDESRLPEPLIPYDQIYARRWNRQTGRSSAD
jgi:glycosyltransferase involved in cell wall biosynthesis